MQACYCQYATLSAIFTLKELIQYNIKIIWNYSNCFVLAEIDKKLLLFCLLVFFCTYYCCNHLNYKVFFASKIHAYVIAMNAMNKVWCVNEVVCVNDKVSLWSLQFKQWPLTMGILVKKES